MTTETKKKKVSILRILFFFYIMFVLVWTFFGDLNINLSYRRAHTPYRHKACLSNCRVIMGGIEMYNMDHNEGYNSTDIPLDPKGSVLDGYYKPNWLQKII